jgi:hypothetical protein
VLIAPCDQKSAASPSASRLCWLTENRRKGPRQEIGSAPKAQTTNSSRKPIRPKRLLMRLRGILLPRRVVGNRALAFESPAHSVPPSGTKIGRL